jgi:hypothetical protein
MKNWKYFAEMACWMPEDMADLVEQAADEALSYYTKELGNKLPKIPEPLNILRKFGKEVVNDIRCVRTEDGMITILLGNVAQLTTDMLLPYPSNTPILDKMVKVLDRTMDELILGRVVERQAAREEKSLI